MKTKLVALLAAAAAAVVAVLMLSGSTAAALETYTVTNENDSGPGSLREALALAQTDDDNSLIVFADGVATIGLDSQLLYTHAESTSYSIAVAGDVTITESGSWSSGDVALLRFEDTAEIELRYLTFTGGYHGFRVTDLVTSVDVTVAGVTSTANSEFGGLVENTAGSGYTVDVEISDSHFDDNGDVGFRAFQEYPADIYVDATNSTFNGNAAGAGLSLNHDDTGNVYSSIVDSHFDGNFGAGLDIDVNRGGADVDVSGSTFDNSVDSDGLILEAYDGGSPDLDVTITNSQAIGNYVNGFYVLRDSDACCSAELIASFSGVRAADNGEEGIEAAARTSTFGIDLSLTNTDVVGNGVDGDYPGVYIQNDSSGPLDLTATNANFISNSDDGLFIEDSTFYSIDVTTTGSVFRNNGYDGAHIYKENPGGVNVTSTASRFVDNGVTGDGDGLEVENFGGRIDLTATASAFDGNGDDGADLTDNDGNGCGESSIEVTATNTSFDDNTDEGLKIDECSDGDIVVRSFVSTADGNGDDGYDLEESGSGSVSFVKLLGSASGNGDNAIDIENGNGLALSLFADLTGNGDGPTEITGGIFTFII